MRVIIALATFGRPATDIRKLVDMQELILLYSAKYSEPEKKFFYQILKLGVFIFHVIWLFRR